MRATSVIAACLALLAACTGDIGVKPDATHAPNQDTPDGGDQHPRVPVGPDAGAGQGDADVGPMRPAPGGMGVCSPDDICWELPSPQGHDLRDVFALDDHDVFAVGAFGTVVHYDGTGFVRHAIDTTADLRAVHASAHDNVWAVGDGGEVWQYDGETWRMHDVDAIVDASKGNKTGQLYDVFAASHGAVWVVGHSGVAAVIGFYDGVTWHDQSLGADTDRALRAIWGAGESDVWAAGDEGVIRHFDGGGWLPAQSPTGRGLRAIHGFDADNVWMVGDEGTLVEWDGSELSVVEDSGIQAHLTAVVVDGRRPDASPMPAAGVEGGAPESRPARVWVFGSDGAIMRFDDLAWTPLASGVRSDLAAATRLGEGQVMVVGADGLMQRYREDERATLSFGANRNRMGLFAMPDGTLYSVGDEVLRSTPAGWAPVMTGSDRSLFAAWGDTDGLWAVGTAGTIVHLTSEGSEEVSVPELQGRWLRSVWGVGDSLWVVGNDGLAAVRAAGGWLTVPAVENTNLLDVWGLAEDDLWAVGESATALHWNGSAWVSIPTSSDDSVVASLHAVWGPASDDLWAVGSLATILHWNGGAWSAEGPGGTFTLNDVWGSSANDVYAVGTRGTVLHFDGSTWTQLDSGTDRSLEAVAMGPDGRIRIAGQDGTLLVVRR